MAQKKKESPFTEFIPEAEELIELLYQNLRQIEAVPDRSNVHPEIINAIFRAAHTLKGMSGMVGLVKVSRLSHHLEEMLDRLRMGKLTLTTNVFETLSDGVDFLQRMIKAAVTEKGEPDSLSMEQRIEALCNGKGEEGEREMQQKIDLDPTVWSVLTEYESHRLSENIRLHSTLFEVKARFPLETFDTDLSALNTRIRQIGEMIATLPSVDASLGGGMGFILIVAVPSGGGALSSEIASDRIVVREISIKKGKEEDQIPTGMDETVPPPVSLPPTGSIREEETSLRSMMQTVRVDVRRLDTLLNMVGELVSSKAEVGEISKKLIEQSGPSGLSEKLLRASRMLDKRVSEFQEGLIEIRLIPIGQLFDRTVRMARKLSKELNKEVDLIVSGEETKMDKSMVEELSDPLLHLIRNAMDHGMEDREERIRNGKPETGTIFLRAVQKGNHVVIEVEDDGRGIDTARIYQKALQRGLVDADKQYEERELINLLFLPGFSTAERVTEISGRGVGLDVVVKNISKLSGLVDVETAVGRGTRFTLTFPITLVIMKALIVRSGGENFALPLNSVSESFEIFSKKIETIGRKEVCRLRDQTLSLTRLIDFFALGRSGVEGKETSDDRLYVVVIGLAEKRIGLLVDAIEGQQEIVIKPLGEILKDVSGIAGATELGNGQTVLVLDVAALVEETLHWKDKRAVETSTQ